MKPMKTVEQKFSEGASMDELFEMAKFDSYREDNRREVKKAEGGLPNSND